MGCAPWSWRILLEPGINECCVDPRQTANNARKNSSTSTT